MQKKLDEPANDAIIQQRIERIGRSAFNEACFVLHRERRVHLSNGDPKGWDDRIARSRLRQAFGRLIRRASDKGVFVLLDRGAPSRLMSAFPEGVVVHRVGLAKAVEETKEFLRDA